MTITTSASPATETSATDNAPDVSPLEQLIERARVASEKQTTNKANKALLQDMAVALVAVARLNADLMSKLGRQNVLYSVDPAIGLESLRAETNLDGSFKKRTDAGIILP